MQLTRRHIVAAAMDLIERDGAAAVSMQRLATELGCGTLALYSYVPSRGDLLDAIAAEIMSAMESTTGAAAVRAPQDAWPRDLIAQIRAYREAAGAFPQCALTVAGRPLAAASAVRPAERALATLAAAGFAGTEALRIIRVLAAYVLGTLLREAGRAVPPHDLPPHDLPPHNLPPHNLPPHNLRLRAKDFPHVTALATEFAEPDGDADFEFGLGLLLQALAARTRGS
jgi:AcrR family transcriptional regulator